MLAIHPLAERLPVMPDDEFRELVESISEHGLKEPLWIFERQVLDGRHRARACNELGITPTTRDYEGTEPAGFVIDANIHRRHLTAAQRATLANDFLPELEAEAKARQGTRTDLGADFPADPRESDKAGWAAKEAARRTGASPRGVERVKRVLEHAPDLMPRLRDGDLGLEPAEREARQRQGTPPYPREQERAGMGQRESQQQRKMLDQISEKCRHISDITPHINYTQISELSEEERQKWLPQLRETRTALSRLIGAL